VAGAGDEAVTLGSPTLSPRASVPAEGTWRSRNSGPSRLCYHRQLSRSMLDSAAATAIIEGHRNGTVARLVDRRVEVRR